MTARHVELLWCSLMAKEDMEQGKLTARCMGNTEVIYRPLNMAVIRYMKLTYLFNMIENFEIT